MNDPYFAELTSKFTALTLEEQARQVKEWIETRPHNEEIIPLGKHCRAADYVDNLNPKYFELLSRAYNDSYNQNQIAEFCSRLRDLALMDSIHNKNAAALPLSICFGSLAAYHVPLDDTGSMRGETISMFARTLRTQWQKTRTNELLDETIEYFRKAIIYGARDGKYRGVHFLDLSEQLRERYVMNHSPADFEEASRCFELSLRVNPAGTPIISLSSANLKEEKNKFDGFGTLQVLNEYIDTLFEALRVTPKDFNHFDYRESLSSVYWHLGHALMRRFSLTKAKSDYQSAAGAFQDAKEAPQHGEGDKLWICLGLGRLMLTEYDLNGRIETAEEAERRLKEALEVRPDSKDVMEWLGELYRLQALHTGSRTTLTQATGLLDRCVEGSDGPPKYFLLTKAAYAHAHLYELLGEKKNIDRAIELLFQASLDSTHSREDKLAGKCKLAHSLVLRFEHAEDEEDLDRALSIIEEAEKADLEGSAVSNCYRIHGMVLNARYQVRRVMTDLQLAIEYYQKVVTIPDSGADRYSAHNDLGNAYLSHYRATGDTQSLLKSAKTYDTALQSFRSSLWKDNKSTECMLLRGLGNTQFYQFETSQRLSDIDLAIACYQRCYDDTALDHIIRVSRAGSLAHALQKRFALTKQIEDAQKSQTVLLEVLDYGFPLAPRAISDLHNDLGSAYLRCYVSSDQRVPLEYLDHAAEHYQKALASGCKIPSYIRTATVNLSTVYRHKASHTRKIQDILPAVKHFIQVLQNISFQERQDPQYEITLWNMAQLVFVYFDVAESRPIQGMLNIVMKFVPSFAQFKTLPRDWIVQTYMRLALLQFREASQPAEALRLVQAAAEEIPGSILLRSLNRTEQLRVIRNLNNVPKMGIVFSLMAGESALSALKLFEASRSVLWDNILANKLDEQTSSMLHEFSELESRFETLRQALSKYENVDVVIDPSSVGVLRQGEQFGQAISYNQILDEIRSKPGLQDFLRLPRDSASLQKYANEGPIIIVNGAPIRSDAIIIRTDGVFSVSLPLFTYSMYEKIRTKQAQALADIAADLERSDCLLTEVLKDLWDVVAEPILDFLGYQGEEGANGTLPRIWWLMTGWIGNLPIHAAGDHEAVLKTGAPLSVIDRAVSSYIGNIRALDYLRSRQIPRLEEGLSQGHEKRALLVKMPTTPDMPEGDLPAAEREAETVRSMCEKAGFQSKALDKPKTPTVLRLVKGAGLVHFACHGISSEGDPLESMLRLADWKSRPLSIGELLKTNDLSCQLVYLSACETALNKLRPLEDEGLHVAGGFQMAGVVNVVASLWRVDDAVSVDVATAFYSGLVGPGGFDFTRSALSLRNTISDLGTKGVKAVLWASYIHLGP